MKKILMSFLPLILLSAILMAQKVTPPLIPMKDFFKNPEKSGYSISPDGKSFAFLMPWESRMNLHVQIIGSSEVKRLTSIKDRDLSGYFWKGSDMLVYLKDNGGNENFHLYSVSTDGKIEKDLTPFEKVRVEVVDELEDSPDELLCQMNKNKPELFDVYRMNVRTGEMTEIAKNPGNITGWLTDNDGKLRIAITTDGVNTSVLYREKETDEFKNIITTNFKETMSPFFFTFDNKNLYAGSNIGRDKVALIEYDLKEKKETKVIYQNNDVDIETPVISKKEKKILGVTYIKEKTEIYYLDKSFEKLMKYLKSQFPGKNVAIRSQNKAEDKFIISVNSDRSKGMVYLYETEGNKLSKLAELSPWLKESDLAEMKPVSYMSRDGLTINGYLTVPKGVELKNLPVVINPHGGPWARDRWGFNPEVQFMANRGYAVLQMNFRGSTGYGRKFLEASFKQWGKNMQNDITDGVNWLIKKGIADPKRIGIYGGSYGGYATLAGITFTPDIYAAAVDYVGVSNMFTFLKTIPPYWKPFLEMFDEMVGNSQKDSLYFVEVSPVYHVDKIKTPLLVAQGANDPRVNKAESDQIVEKLKQRGVDVVYIVKDNEGHGFRNEENRFEFYRAMEQFLAKHLGGKSEK